MARIGYEVTIKTTLWWSDEDVVPGRGTWDDLVWEVKELSTGDILEHLVNSTSRTCDLVEKAGIRNDITVRPVYDAQNS